MVGLRKSNDVWEFYDWVFGLVFFSFILVRHFNGVFRDKAS